MVLDLKGIGKVDFTAPVIVVTGSRFFEEEGPSSIPYSIWCLCKDIWEIRATKTTLSLPQIYLYQGGARGADRMAARAFKDHPSIVVVEFPADWSRGTSAGPVRNQTMLDTVKYLNIFSQFLSKP